MGNGGGGLHETLGVNREDRKMGLLGRHRIRGLVARVQSEVTWED